MNLKLLFLINDDEKKINKFLHQFNLPFNTLLRGVGTASQGVLDFLGLRKTEKKILLSIVPDYLEDNIMCYLRAKGKINDHGAGIAFTVPMASSPKYMQEAFEKGEGKMIEKVQYHLIITIVNDGDADKIMNVAKRNGANGGTLIKGRGLGGKNSFKLFNLTVEPEKDLILIVCKDANKNKIMNSILEKGGMNTDIKGFSFSLPIDSIAGFDE